MALPVANLCSKFALPIKWLATTNNLRERTVVLRLFIYVIKCSLNDTDGGLKRVHGSNDQSKVLLK